METKTALNTSDHIPVCEVLKIATSDTKQVRYSVQCKPKWEKCDSLLYKKSVSHLLKPFDSFFICTNSELEILYPLCHLNAVLKVATMKSIPKYKPIIELKNRKKRPWTEKINDAVKNTDLNGGSGRK